VLALIPALGAIAAGNTVVLKPCVVSPASAKLMAELLPKYVDSSILSIIGADMDGDRACTGALLKEKFDLIFFTGSTTVGKVVARGAAEHLTPCILELGGKNPVYVHKDADIGNAARRIVWGRMLNGGQQVGASALSSLGSRLCSLVAALSSLTSSLNAMNLMQCVAPDYVLCHEDVIEEFEEKCAFYIKSSFGDDAAARKASVDFGRLVGAKQHKRVSSLLDVHGGAIVCGGECDADTKYIAPTVVRVPFDSPMMEAETFGPVLLTLSVKTLNEAVEYISEQPKPLAQYIFAKSDAAVATILQSTSAGGVTVNGTIFHAGHPGSL
tara:strand:- start:64 stop:1041 length:978 start_codon:yes stop_codon:yes gene_type:complete